MHVTAHLEESGVAVGAVANLQARGWTVLGPALCGLPAAGPSLPPGSRGAAGSAQSLLLCGARLPRRERAALPRRGPLRRGHCAQHPKGADNT
jgi:hypothetical protein